VFVGIKTKQHSGQ